MAICDGDAGFGFIPADEARNKARDDFTIWCEIQAIQQEILRAIGQCQYSVTVAGNTPMTYTSPVTSIAVTDGGQNYQPVNASVVFIHPNGTGATGTVVVEGTTVTEITVTDGGTGYDPIPATVDTSTEGNGDAIVSVRVYEGSIVEATVVVSGTGYVAGSILPVEHPVGQDAVLEVASVGSAGNILSVRIVNAGIGYETINAQVMVVHPSGVGFEGVALIDASRVSSVVVTRGGVGYQPLMPEVVITDETGQGATAEAILGYTADGTAHIADIVLTNGGYGYKDPQVVIQPAQGSSGTGATAEATAGKNEDCSCCVEGHCPKYTAYDYYAVWQGSESNRMIQDQLDAVISFFENLGYSIYINTNPATGLTIQWNVMW